jgi:hypothetical protein
LLLLGDELPATVDPAAIPNYTRVRPGLAVAGKAVAGGARPPEGAGVQDRDRPAPESEGLADEKASVEGQGCATSRAHDLRDLLARDALKVKGVLDDPASGPVLLHCAAANRAGGVFAVIEAKSGKSLEQAIEEGRRPA